jgi:uncharacterized protein (TIGR00369 family)
MTPTPPDEPTTDAAAADGPWGAPRSKVVEWFDPLAVLQAGATLSGREYLEKMANGELPPPPIAKLFGFDAGEVGDGTITFWCTPDESAYNPVGLVHGGLVCTLLDSVIGCAVHTTLPAGVGYTSIDITINYLRPVTKDTGQITAVGTVTKPGRRVAFGEGKVFDAAGKLLATATSSCLIMSG